MLQGNELLLVGQSPALFRFSTACRGGYAACARGIADLSCQTATLLLVLELHSGFKEEVARAYAAKHSVYDGLACVLQCVEPCWSFDLDKKAVDRFHQHLCLSIETSGSFSSSGEDGLCSREGDFKTFEEGTYRNVFRIVEFDLHSDWHESR